MLAKNWRFVLSSTRAQDVISSIERKQPIQICLAFSEHWLIQGDETVDSESFILAVSLIFFVDLAHISHHNHPHESLQ